MNLRDILGESRAATNGPPVASTGTRRTAVRLAVLTVLLWAVFTVCASAATTHTATRPKGSAGPSGTKTAVARAASAHCSDSSIQSGSVWSSPGPGPGYSHKVIGSFNAFQGFPLTCYFYNNVGEGRWYAEVPTGHYGNRQYGYIWVQRLFYGSDHECDDGTYIWRIPSGPCVLIYVND